MDMVPVVLERWIIAGLLLIPAGGLLSLVALEGQAGRLTTGIVLISAVLYAGLVFVLLRRDLRAQVAAAAPAAAEARLEPLGSTALRALPRVVLAILICVGASIADLVVVGVGVAIGAGMVAAMTALQLQRAERREQTLLVRPGGPLWEPSRPLQRF
ncbi:MAG: hypothetical protein H0V22_11690 [Solirubrobacterales bacterium]|nr:hypothetical protein [Solirubrobacterales bacterium]